MRLTVVFDDGIVLKDGVGYHVTLPSEPDIWAIQWDGDTGHVEYRDQNVANVPITENPSEGELGASILDQYVSLWQAAHDIATAPPPPLTFADRKAAMLAALANRRWLAETSGIVVNGLPVPTDDKTQNRVDQIVKAYEDGDITGAIDFKAGGVWISLTEPHFRAIKAAGATHIQACFSREKQIATAIGAAEDHDALDQIDIHSGWPTT